MVISGSQKDTIIKIYDKYDTSHFEYTIVNALLHLTNSQ